MSPCVASAGKLRGGAALGDVGAAVFDFQMETQAGGGAVFLLREFFRKKAFGDKERKHLNSELFFSFIFATIYLCSQY